MAYPESCFSGLIGIREICEPPTDSAFWLDDIPGIDLAKLAQVAEASAPTGQKLGMKLIDTASRLMAADVEAIYDASYKVQNTLVSGCSACKFTANSAQGSQLGTLLKDNTQSNLSQLLLDKFQVKIYASGTFHMVIDDGNAANMRIIEHVFETGVEYEFTGLNYKTKSKQVKMYFQENNIPLAQLSCPTRSSGCGCTGTASAVADLVYTGLSNGAEAQNAYGFKPCAVIMCEAADLLCFVAHSAPRMIGMALLYKTAELYFQTRLQSARNNKIVGTNEDAVKEDAAKYSKLYKEKLNGTGTRGVKDLVFTTLQQTNDVCIVCNSLLGTAWATG